MLYLDNAATTLRKPLRVYTSFFYNTVFNSVNAGHGGHQYSMRGAVGVYDTVEALAELLNIDDPEQIAFTYNATYAINLAIRSILRDGDHTVTTCMEHNSVLRTLYDVGQFTMVDAGKDGTIGPAEIERAIRPETKLIVVSHATNTSGTVQNIKRIGKIAKKHGIIFMVDAAQSVGCVDIDVKDMGIDVLAFSAHKGLLGPLGVGVIYVSRDIGLKPVITGGTGSDSKMLAQPGNMPDLFHSGTMNTPAIMACKSSVKYLLKRGVENIGAEERYLAERLIENLCDMQGVTVYGKKNGNFRNGTVLFNVGDLDSVTVSEILEKEHGIAVRGGWHCAYQAHKALGTAENGAVRASFGAFDGVRSVERLTDAVYKISKYKAN